MGDGDENWNSEGAIPRVIREADTAEEAAMEPVNVMTNIR